MADLKGFSERMTLLALRTTERVDLAVRKCALAVDQALVMSTPIDTGRARSNWLVSLGVPRETVLEPYSPGTQGSTARENIQGALDQAASVVAEYKGGTSIYIANNVPYIQKLNQGWSAQAPANFVEQAVIAGVQAVSSVRIVG